jgi:hypothetical protein
MWQYQRLANVKKYFMPERHQFLGVGISKHQGPVSVGTSNFSMSKSC